jgi:hypothetical protein
LYLFSSLSGRRGCFDAYVDKEQAKGFFEKMQGVDLTSREVIMKVNRLLREFLLKGG